jgi:hypothetical protein
MLTAAEDAQLEGAVSTRDEAMQLVRARFGEPDARFGEPDAVAQMRS